MGWPLGNPTLYMYVSFVSTTMVHSLHNPDAAADACVALAIYDKMMAIEPLATARKSLWIFTEYDSLNSQCVGLRDDYAPHVAMNPKYIRSIEGALRKARTIFQQANETLPGDDTRTWTEQVMPEASALLDELTRAFSVYHARLDRDITDSYASSG